jgi:hypothetical protein
LIKEFQNEAPFFIPFFYIYRMETEALRQEIIAFFENIQKYYGCKTEMTQGLFSDLDNIDAKLTTWNLSEFELARSAYRNSGGKFMLEGNGSYFEISGEKIIDFKKTGRNKFEFTERYSEAVFRITKIRFHYKY